MNNHSGGTNNPPESNTSNDKQRDEQANADPAEDSGRWQQIDRLFTEALGLPEQERDSFLQKACGDDQELRAAVNELLAEDGGLDSFLEQPLGADEIEKVLGDDATVGPYRLLGQLGAGGMGTVYLAAQSEPVERKVALKLISPGLDSAQVLARFAAERQALALMDHVNIATVFDAGCTESGRSYFAMEYVPGHTITEHCDRQGLGIRDRVRMFLQVCDGVQHAHQKGLIHRDLKPGNILVRKAMGEKPTVKIIDFGVAKSLQRQLTDGGAHTQLGTFVGTPVYSSPEQIMGRFSQTDTRSDIYSIGVVLYEMLVGRAPHDSDEFDGKTQEEIASLLTERPLPSPLERFKSSMDNAAEIARKRSQSIEALQQRLGGDISWILQKCLEGNPDDRYPSVSEVRKDLERWLNGLPLEARPSTRLYRLQKLIRRNKKAVATAALVSLAILTTTTVAIIGFFRAAESAEQARQAALEAELAADFQVEQLAGIDPAAMGVELRLQLLDSIEESIVAQSLDAESGGVNISPLDLFLANVNFTDLSLSLLDQHIFKNARFAIEEKYGDAPLLQARLWQSLADTLSGLGLNRQAIQPQQRALEIRRQRIGPGSIEALESLRGRGNLWIAIGQIADAESDLRLAVGQYRNIFGEEDPRYFRVLNDLGNVLLARNEVEEAQRLFREALEGQRRILGEEHPDTLESMKNVGLSLQYQGDNERAHEFYSNALQTSRRILGNEHKLSVTLLNYLAINSRDVNEAEQLLREVMRILEETVGTKHPDTVSATQNLAAALTSKGNHNEAEALFREALDTSIMIQGNTHRSTLSIYGNLGYLLRKTGELDEAEQMLRRALEARRRSADSDNPNQFNILSSLGSTLYERGEFGQAEALLLEALNGIQNAYGNESFRSQRTLMRLGRVLDAQMRYSDLLSLGEKHVPPPGTETVNITWPSAVCWGLSGNALAGLGRYEEAESALLDSFSTLDEILPKSRRLEVLSEAASRLVLLYESWNKPALAANWRSKLESLREVATGENL